VITERKNADLRLRASEERLRLALGAAKAGTWEWDLRTGENVWSDELWQLFGLSRDSVSPSYDSWLATVAPSDRERIVAALDAAVRAGTDIDIEWRVRGAGGEDRWLMSRGKPEFDGSGRALRYLGAVIDISDRKRTEEKVGELLDEKELILKEVHHRVKNNLNTIYSFLTLQADSTGEPFARRALMDAGSRVQSMLLLYDRLYQSDSFGSMRVDLYLSPLIDQILEVFPNRESVRVLKRIEAFSLDANRLQHLGVIVNELLTNIMKYAFVGKGEGEIIVEASSVGGLVAVAIQDDGDGLPESIDFRHSNGFGLMLVEGLTKQLKGSVRIDRRGGTRIVLEFWK
jgi:PAS domain S-box-containing protein